MPNTWEKNMLEQGYNYFDGPIHSAAEFFETMMENLEKAIPPSVPSRNSKKTKKKESKERKSVTFDDSEDENSKVEHKSIKF